MHAVPELKKNAWVNGRAAEKLWVGLHKKKVHPSEEAAKNPFEPSSNSPSFQARALRVVQRRKQKVDRGLHTTSESEGQTHDERPPSRNSEASDTSRPATPIPTTRDRRLTPGLGQCEILTEEVRIA